MLGKHGKDYMRLPATEAATRTDRFLLQELCVRDVRDGGTSENSNAVKVAGNVKCSRNLVVKFICHVAPKFSLSSAGNPWEKTLRNMKDETKLMAVVGVGGGEKQLANFTMAYNEKE